MGKMRKQAVTTGNGKGTKENSQGCMQKHGMRLWEGEHRGAVNGSTGAESG